MNFKIIFFLITTFLLSGFIVYADTFSQTAMLADANEIITFDATKLFPNKQLTNVEWDFGDNTKGEGMQVNHSYYTDNVYDVIATAYDAQENTYSMSLPVIVGSVQFVSDSVPYVSLYFTKKPKGIFSITVRQSDTTEVSTSGFIVGGKFFDINSDLPNGEFNATLIFSYSDVDNNGIVDGTNIDENMLDTYFYNGVLWVIVPNSIKNMNSNILTVKVDHFTLFTLLSPQTSQQSDNSGNTAQQGGNSGGGGGFVGGTSGTTNQTTTQGCQERWGCSEWSACQDGTQTRTCNDVNNCGTRNNEPLTAQPCSAKEIEESKTPASLGPTGFFLGMPISNWLLGIAIGIVIAVFIIFFFRRKPKGKK